MTLQIKEKPQDSPLTFLNKFFFGMGEIPNTTAKTALGVIFMIYLTDVVGLIPALAGSVFMIGRVWDGFSDPMMGFITDRTRTRFGRRRPFFLIAAIPMALVFYFMFYPLGLETQTQKMVIYTAIYVLFMTFITVYGVPYLTMMTELTDDYSQRTSLANFRMFFSLVFGLFAVVVPEEIAKSYVPEELKLAVKQGLASAEDKIPYLQEGYSMAGTIIAILLLVFPFILFATTRERYKDVKKPPRLEVFSEFRQLIKNKPFLLLLVIYVGCFAAINVIEGFVLYYIKYWIQDDSVFQILMITVVLVSVVSLPLWTLMTRKIGKRNTTVFGLTFWGLTQLLWMVIDGNTPHLLIYVTGALVGLGYGAAHTMPWAIFPDVMDLDELETGKRREGIYAGLMMVTMKTGNALAMSLIGITLSAVGYIANQPQTGMALQAMRGIMTFGPWVFIVPALISAWFFPITPERYKKIWEDLVSKRQTETAS